MLRVFTKIPSFFFEELNIFLVFTKKKKIFLKKVFTKF